MRVRLGINNCFALKRWPAAREWASVVRDDLGLGLVELSLDLLEGFDDPRARPRVVEATRTALTDNGLTAQSTFTGLGAYSLNLLMHPNAERREAAQRWFERVIDVSAELRVRATGGHIGSMSVPEWSDRALRAQRWAGLKTYLSALAARARDAGLDHLMVENMVAVREPATIAQVEDLLDPGDAGHVPVRLCLDVGHQVVPGTSGPDRDPYAWLARFGADAAEVQLQQSDAAADHHWPFTPEHNAVGRIDPARVLETLANAGASEVLLMLEIIPGFEEEDGRVIGELQTSVKLWRDAIAARNDV